MLTSSSWIKRGALALAAILLLYYPLGMIWVYDVNDRPDGLTLSAETQGSQAVQTMVALMERETKDHRWTPNDPFFLPSGMMVRMPAFQRGVVGAVARLSLEFSDQIGRTRGSSQVDADLQKATGLFNYPPDVWFYDWSVSWLPTASSESQYREAVEALLRYNARLIKGEARFEIRGDNLLAALDRIASDVGSSSAAISEAVEHKSGFAFAGNAELFYLTKGRMVAYYHLLKALEQDFAPVIAEKGLQNSWAQMLHSLEIGMQFGNLLIFNADPDALLIPNHLASQGFYLMRTRTQLREISDILYK